MKKQVYFILILSMLVVSSAHAIHNAVVNAVGYTSSYETNDVIFRIRIENDDAGLPARNHSITNISLTADGVGFLSIFDSESWRHINTSSNILWSTTSGNIDPGFSGTFNFNGKLERTDEDKTYSWTVLTTDTNNDNDVNALQVLVLNDSINPRTVISYPDDYVFLKNDSFSITLNVDDPETGIDYNSNPRIIYDDNNVPTDIANVFFNLSLFRSGDGVLSAALNPNELMTVANAPYLDYKIIDVKDMAGNNFVDSSTHHAFIDDQAPIVKPNLVSGFRTSNKNHVFYYNVSDNSFATRGMLSFDPEVDCTLYIKNDLSRVVNANINYGANITNSPVTSNLNSIADGNYDAEFECKDKADFTALASTSFTLDTAGPSITLESPPNRTVISNSTQIQLRVNDVSGVSNVWYMHINTNTTINASQSDSSLYVIEPYLWQEGINNFIFYALDSLGNLNSKNFLFTIDNTPPEIKYLSPVLGTNLSLKISNSSLLVSYNASDSYSENLLCRSLAVDTNFSSFVSDFDRNVKQSEVTAFFMDLNVSGDWLLYTLCIDEGGNAAVNITAARIDNEAPSLNLVSPHSIFYTNSTRIEFKYNVEDIYGIDACSLYLNENNTMTDYFVLNNISQDNTFVRDMDDERYYWYVECSDKVKNKAISSTRTLVVDTLKPNININLNSLMLEKQVDYVFTNFSVSEANKNYSYLKIINSSNSALFNLDTESETLRVQGLTLGTGNFTVEAYAQDLTGNYDNKIMNFEVVDSLPPVILSYSPSNNSAFGSSTLSVTFNLTTDEPANCRFTTNESLGYSDMPEMSSTNSTTHVLILDNLVAGNSYNYYFLCSDGEHAMVQKQNIFFSVSSSAPSNPISGGGGGGGGNNQLINNTSQQVQVTAPTTESSQPVTSPVTNQQTVQSEQTQQNNIPTESSPITGFAIFDNLKKHKKEALIVSSLAILGALGSYGVIRFRKYKEASVFKTRF